MDVHLAYKRISFVSLWILSFACMYVHSICEYQLFFSFHLSLLSKARTSSLFGFMYANSNACMQLGYVYS